MSADTYNDNSFAICSIYVRYFDICSMLRYLFDICSIFVRYLFNIRPSIFNEPSRQPMTDSLTEHGSNHIFKCSKVLAFFLTFNRIFENAKVFLLICLRKVWLIVHTMTIPSNKTCISVNIEKQGHATKRANFVAQLRTTCDTILTKQPLCYVP